MRRLSYRPEPGCLSPCWGILVDMDNPNPMPPIAGGPRVRWFVAVMTFILFGLVALVLAYGWLWHGQEIAATALFGGWSALVAAVVYITHPGADNRGGGEAK